MKKERHTMTDKMSHLVELGSIIRDCRTRSNMSVRNLADRADVRRNHVIKLEKGLGYIGTKKLFNIVTSLSFTNEEKEEVIFIMKEVCTPRRIHNRYFKAGEEIPRRRNGSIRSVRFF